MATCIPRTGQYYKEQSCESINVENINEVSYHSTENVSKLENYNERRAFYKKPIKKSNHRLEVDFHDTPQEIRRQQILCYQKKNRNIFLNASRGLLKDIFEDEEDIKEDLVKKKQCKLYKNYGRLLMLSEWMLEVPQDFAEKWIMVPCPLGKRVLIVASKGLTKIYTRKGLQISVLKTMLPGGSKETFKNSYTILDCILVKNKKMCYVLDVLVWSNQEMFNCETEFRFFWFRSQLEDIHQLKGQISDTNDYQFLLLPAVTCDHNFYECLKNISTSISLDGLLFYHKEAHYTNGRTPLVTWLKMYMLPEVLGLNVPEPYDEKPDNYIDFDHHILKIIKNEKEKTENRQKKKQQYENLEENVWNKCIF